MKKLLTLVTLGLSLSLGAAHAAEGDAKTAQQSKMGTCNKEAGAKKGDERRAFMKECLGAPTATQQSKMGTCNKEAGAKKGDERKAFRKECLSAKK